MTEPQGAVAPPLRTVGEVSGAYRAVVWVVAVYLPTLFLAAPAAAAYYIYYYDPAFVPDDGKPSPGAMGSLHGGGRGGDYVHAALPSFRAHGSAGCFVRCRLGLARLAPRVHGHSCRVPCPCPHVDARRLGVPVRRRHRHRHRRRRRLLGAAGSHVWRRKVYGG